MRSTRIFVLLLPYMKKIPDTYMYTYYYASLSLGLCNNSANRHVYGKHFVLHLHQKMRNIDFKHI